MSDFNLKLARSSHATTRGRWVLSLSVGLCLGLVLALFATQSSDAALATTPPPSVSPRDFISLESLSYDEVCGEDRSGQTRCLKSGTGSTWVPDSVGQLTSAYSNTKIGCGFDEDGLKCWRLPSGKNPRRGEPEPEAFRQLLRKSDPSSIQTSESGVCGTRNKARDLECLLIDWPEVKDGVFTFSSKDEIHLVSASNSVLCWAERASGPTVGRKIKSRISCTTAFPKIIKAPTVPDTTNLTEITVGFDWICARSKTEARCFTDQSAIPLDLDFKEAKTWQSAHENLCALTQDNRTICVDPKTGNSPQSGLGRYIPQEFIEPNPDIEQLWISSSQACTMTFRKEVYCWDSWSTAATKVTFTPKLTRLFGSGTEPCGQMSDGGVECRLFYSESRTLSKPDRVRIEFGGYNKCFWNSSGVDCRGRYDTIDYRSVRSVTASREQESLCVIGVRSDQASEFETVRCYSHNTELDSPPFELSNPTSVASTDDKACAIADDGLVCWGQAYDDVPMPTSTLNPSKVLLGRRHACALDDFGLICWGELSAFSLEIPSDLQQPGRVTDFALGASRTCAVLDTGGVECWGRDYELSGPPPRMTNVKSLVGRGGLFCALDDTRVRCWGGETGLPK